VRSTYVWRAKVERDSEVTLAFKTTADRVAALTARVLSLHPYELPEVIALAIEPGEGHAPYLDWVRSQVTPAPDAPTMPPAS
jgi:periplasmic divalent cation tolerance protein